MSVRNWIGVMLALATFGLFSQYVHQGGELTAVAGFIFGGGLLFCGILIDFDHFLELFRVWKGGGK